MSVELTIKSRVYDYSVEGFGSLPEALSSAVGAGNQRIVWLVDRRVEELYHAAFAGLVDSAKIVRIDASETTKSLEAVPPIFLELLQRGIKRDGKLVVVGGGVVQDIGCFIATVLFRGLTWELIPTTLLAQADSCIGSKSSINVGSYKNQIGTFYPPRRVLLVPSVVATLSADEIRSGLGEIIKLQLLKGPAESAELAQDLSTGQPSVELLNKWVFRSLRVKQAYIEVDEYDRGIRNLLNYGHTFGHAYESATHYAIPHGIAVTLGMLTATYVSAQMGLASDRHYQDLRSFLRPWYEPYQKVLKSAALADIFKAIRHDKKNTGDAVVCILTRGPGLMEKTKVDFEGVLMPAVTALIQNQI